MALTRADGAAVVTQSSVVAVGAMPPEDEIRALASALSGRRQEIFATVSMAET